MVVYTRVQTPRFWGFFWSAGDLFFFAIRALPFLTSWFKVGMAAWTRVLVLSAGAFA